MMSLSDMAEGKMVLPLGRRFGSPTCKSLICFQPQLLFPSNKTAFWIQPKLLRHCYRDWPFEVHVPHHRQISSKGLRQQGFLKLYQLEAKRRQLLFSLFCWLWDRIGFHIGKGKFNRHFTQSGKDKASRSIFPIIECRCINF